MNRMGCGDSSQPQKQQFQTLILPPIMTLREFRIGAFDSSATSLLPKVFMLEF